MILGHRVAFRGRQRLSGHAWECRGGPGDLHHGTFINGFHETWPIRHAEEAFGFARVGQTIVNVPDNKTIKLYVDDEPMLLAVADLESYSAPWTSVTVCCVATSSGGRREASASRCPRLAWCRSPNDTWRS